MTDEQWVLVVRYLVLKAKDYGVEPSDHSKMWDVVLRNELPNLRNEPLMNRYIKQRELDALVKERDQRDSTRQALDAKIAELEAELG